MTAVLKAGSQSREPNKPGDLLLGEDWVSPEALGDAALRAGRRRRRISALNHSPMARKIIVFNLIGLVVLVAGVLFFNPFRDTLVLQREQGLVTEAQLIAQAFQTRLAPSQPSATQSAAQPSVGNGLADSLAAVRAEPGVQLFLFDGDGILLGQTVGAPAKIDNRQTVISDFLNLVWNGVSGLMRGGQPLPERAPSLDVARKLTAQALAGKTVANSGFGPQGGAQFTVAAPVMHNGQVLGVVALASAEGEIDKLVRDEREQILQMFVIALFVSIGLSLVLASTIANPLSDLAAAAELGRDRDARRVTPGAGAHPRPRRKTG